MSKDTTNDEEGSTKTMTLEERRSFLSMACEHDRVDIIQSILTKGETNVSVCATPDKKDGSVPPPKEDNLLELLLNTAPFESARIRSPIVNTELVNGDVEPVKKQTTEEPKKVSETVITEEDDEYSLASDEEYEYYEEEVSITSSEEAAEFHNETNDQSEHEPNAAEEHEPQQIDEDQKDEPLEPFIPPLHVAIANGSVGATNCLLRLGADPSVPCYFPPGYDQTSVTGGGGPLMKYYGFHQKGGGGAYDLIAYVTLSQKVKEQLQNAFHTEALRAIHGDESDRLRRLLAGGLPKDVSFGGMTLKEWAVEMKAEGCKALVGVEPKDDVKAVVVVDTNVAVAVPGWDKKLSSGVPSKATASSNGDAGPKVESAASNSNSSQSSAAITAAVETPLPADPITSSTSTIPSTPQKNPLTTKHILFSPSPPLQSLRRDIEEAENVCTVLTESLDNLTHEVSICHQLLIGGESHGSSALVSLVRSLKAGKAQRLVELDHFEDRWRNAEWKVARLEHNLELKQREVLSRAQGQFRDSTNTLNGNGYNGYQNYTFEQLSESPYASAAVEEADGVLFAMRNDELTEVDAKSKLEVIYVASQSKVRKLRASVADLAEENARNLEEVERLGLSGAVRMARSLRDEQREIANEINDAKRGEAICMQRLRVLEKRIRLQKSAEVTRAAQPQSSDMGSASPAGAAEGAERQQANGGNHMNDDAAQQQQHHQEPLVGQGILMNNDDPNEDYVQVTGGGPNDNGDDTNSDRVDSTYLASDSIARGNSTSLAVRETKRYYTLELFEVLKRIMGLGQRAVARSAQSFIRSKTRNKMMTV